MGIINKFTFIKRSFIYLLVLLCCLISASLQAQNKKTRILFILDASSSMTYNWNADYNRFGIARNILLQIVDSIYTINNEVEFAVRLYGADYPAQEKNCFDSKLLVPFNLQNVNQIKQSLKYTDAIGWSPIAYSLEQASISEINNTAAYDYSIIFITDGGESCGGDICKTYINLLEKKVSVRPYIIGLDKNENLKSYYECLGKFVPVLDVPDIAKAVKLILDENKPILNKEKQLNLTTVYSNSPIKKSTSNNDLSGISRPDTMPVRKDTPSVVKTESPAVAPRQTFVFPKLKLKDNIRKEVLEISRPTIQQVAMPLQILYVFEFEEVPPVPVRTNFVFPMLKPFSSRWRFVYAYRVPDIQYFSPAIKEVEYVFSYEAIKRDTVITVSKPVNNEMPLAQGSSEQPNTAVSREVINHNKTMVQVFFVNKYQRNRMYKKATPTITIKDANTNREVGSFIRSINGSEPTLQPINPGTYNFIVKGDNRIVTPKVTIDENKINKVFIEVTDGTIQFDYIGNASRPVKEFQAIINPRFDNDQGKTRIQECSEKLYYPPGTYYIEINTIPATKFAMVEMDFGEIRSIQLYEPGFLQINNTNNLGTVDFYEPSNDKFVKFHSIEVNGKVSEQKIRMQPPARGIYKVVYLKNPAVPELGTIKKTFTIQSNQTTSLLLD